MMTTTPSKAIFGKIGTLVREPFIRYDRSGRSSGVAIITFETPAEAKLAKRQLDGVLAKGQPIAIQFDQTAPRRASAPPSSLLSRIQKPPLLNRLDKAHSEAKKSLMQSKKLGPVRGRGRGRGSGAGRGRGANAPPKSAAELDSEIDAFMAVDSASGTPAAKSAENGDVEMA
jgi:THO complex subunit 4